MPVTLLPGQHVVGTLKPESSPGVAAPVDGIPEWASSNPSIVTVEPSTDGMTCTVRYGGAGASQVSAVMDANMGSGVRELTILDDVTCAVAEATMVGIEWGTPEGGTPSATAKGAKR